MGVIFAVNELPTHNLRQKVETSVREILGDSPEAEVCLISIHASTFHLYYRVVVEWQGSRWERLFFEKADAVPEAVANWLKLYPPRRESERSVPKKG